MTRSIPLAQTLPLLAAAALVGILHMSAPDHWVTLCVLGRRSSWSQGRLMGLGAVTAGGHALLSIVLGLGVVLVGVVFSRGFSYYVTLATGGVMLVLGLAYGLRTLLSETGVAAGEAAGGEKGDPSKRGAAYFVVLGGVLSPDLSILPVFLLASQVALTLVFTTALVFAAASVLSLLVLIAVGSRGIGRALTRVPQKYSDSLVGFVIAAVGAYVLIFG